MKYLQRGLIAGFFLVSAVAGQTTLSEFKEPWKDPTRALIIDPFRGNTLDFDALAAERRVAAIIHKATDCVSHKAGCRLRSDTAYTDRRKEAKRRGYLWGSYHLGGPGNPVQQADFYLDFTKPADDEVIALDLEDISPRYMSLRNAEIFIRHIRERTGRYPLLYVSNKVRLAIQQSFGPDSEFARTRLWYARYCRDITGAFDSSPSAGPSLWTRYTLWQFASEVNCPSNTDREINCATKNLRRCPLSAPIPGTQYDMDVNVYNGTVEELRARWPFTSQVEPATVTR